MTSYEEYEPEEPRGWSPLAVALIATLVLLLGLGGALFGINVANKNKQVAQERVLPEVIAHPTVGATPTATPTTATSVTPTPSLAPTTTPPPAGDTFGLPDLAGLDFQVARTKVRDLKLGWRLEFGATGTESTVQVTEPKASTMVHRGDTIKIFVKGAAPLATVPGVKGLACAEAANVIVDRGLYPTYLTSRDGVVLSQVPTSSDPPALHWNDQVQISCGAA